MDTEAFDVTVGSVVREAVDAGRPLRVYGEMVAQLWVAGDVEGCLTLETMWNDLARHLPFSLLCAYPATSDGPSRFSDPVSRVFHLHSALVPQPRSAPSRTGGDGEQLTRRFEAQLDAPWAARRFLFQSLRRWGLGGLSDDAAVVLSELVTNAIVHTSAPFTVVLRSLGDSVRLEVTDASPLPPARRNNPAAGPLTQSGRGLALVAALATSWGWEPVGGGKVVWADVGP
jgi:anti-sigma regulatory factor (Ser/Thr protein kinase)